MHGFCTDFARFQTVQWVFFVAKSDKGCKNYRVKNHVALYENDDGSKLPSFETNPRLALLISGPRVRVPGGAPDIECQIVRSYVLFCYVTPKNRGLHGHCTVFARSAFLWESSAWAGITLKCVVNFASSQQSQTELRLYFGVCILQKFQQSSHRDGRFACGEYSLRAGAFLFRIESFLELPTQLHTGGLLDMSVGVHQHIRRSVACVALHRLEVAIRLQELVGGTGVAQTVEHDLLKLRVFCSPQTVPLCQQLRRNGQAVREPEQLPIGRPPIPCNRTPVTWQENSLFLHTGHPVIFLILLRLHGYRERKNTAAMRLFAL